jgi:hypothetical protein
MNMKTEKPLLLYRQALMNLFMTIIFHHPLEPLERILNEEIVKWERAVKVMPSHSEPCRCARSRSTAPNKGLSPYVFIDFTITGKGSVTRSLWPFLAFGI